MKSTIHPKWYPEAKVSCACGNTFVTGSTKEEIKVEVCSACHPFFTGTQKYVDSLGRLERFQAKQQATAGKVTVSKRKKKLLKKMEENTDTRPKTLREMFEKAKAS